MVSIDLSSVVRDGHAVVGLRGAGGALLLATPQQLVIRVLSLTGLAEVFPVHASVAQAEFACARHRPV